MAKRPKIAVTTRLELATIGFYLAHDYTGAIAAFGGTPLIQDIGAQVEGCLQDAPGIRTRREFRETGPRTQSRSRRGSALPASGKATQVARQFPSPSGGLIVRNSLRTAEYAAAGVSGVRPGRPERTLRRRRTMASRAHLENGRHIEGPIPRFRQEIC